MLPIVFMVSCDNSDDIDEVLTKTTTSSTNTIFIETDATHEQGILLSSLAPVTLTVGINNAPSTDVTAGFSVTRDGATAVEGVDYTLADVTIAAGENFGSSDITFLTNGTFEITVSSTSSGAQIVANKAIYLVPSEVTFTLTWGDAFYDYDLFLMSGMDASFVDIYANPLPAGVDVLAFSNGFTTTETFDVIPPIGDSFIYIEDYWNDNASIPCVLTITVDGVDQTFDITMDMDKFGLSIETTVGSDGFPEYSFSAL